MIGSLSLCAGFPDNALQIVFISKGDYYNNDFNREMYHPTRAEK